MNPHDRTREDNGRYQRERDYGTRDYGTSRERRAGSDWDRHETGNERRYSPEYAYAQGGYGQQGYGSEYADENRDEDRGYEGQPAWRRWRDRDYSMSQQSSRYGGPQ